MHAVVAEIFAHRDARVWRKILQRSGLRSGCSNNDGIFHRAVFFELTHDLSNGGALLADGNIDAVELLALIVALIGGLLVDEGVDGNGGLAGLAVADDQLALTAADGNQRVNGLEAGLDGLMHRFARNDARRFLFDAHALCILDRALAIDGIRSEEHTSELQSLMRISD